MKKKETFNEALSRLGRSKDVAKRLFREGCQMDQTNSKYRVTHCPVALWLNKQGFHSARVNSISARPDVGPHTSSFDLPEKVRTFVDELDAGKHPNLGPGK